jgi:hypothetical protein
MVASPASTGSLVGLTSMSFGAPFLLTPVDPL